MYLVVSSFTSNMTRDISFTYSLRAGLNTWSRPVFIRFIENVATDSDFGQLDRNLVTRVGNGSLDQADQAAATGDFHINHVDKLDVVGLNDLGQFLPIGACIIEFRAADDGDLPFHKAAMKIGIGERCAVGGHQ